MEIPLFGSGDGDGDVAPVIPFELVDEEEMSAIEAAVAHATVIPSPFHQPLLGDSPPRNRPLSAASLPHQPPPLLRSCTDRTKLGYCRQERLVSIQLQPEATVGDIEELRQCRSEDVKESIKTRRVWQPRTDISGSKREYKSLCVTDLTAMEWCEKQVEFTLTQGRPEKTFAMKAGNARHLELEIEVSTKVEVEVQSREDSWAVRMVNFLVGIRQLYDEGLTRELPVLGLLENTWILGVIDELRMCHEEGVQSAYLVDTKTRLRPSPPSEAQKRNARLQLMCYKLLWDTMTQKGISEEIMCECFDLQPHQPLSKSVKSHIDALNLHSGVSRFQDVMRLFNEACLSLPLSYSSLLLRYEWQADRSILGEDKFPFELDWCMDRLKWHLEYWQGRRPATFVVEDEHWKCNFCSFAVLCPAVNTSMKKKTDSH